MEMIETFDPVVDIPRSRNPVQLTITPEQDQARAKDNKALNDIARLLATSTERPDIQLDEIFHIVAQVRLIVADEERYA